MRQPDIEIYLKDCDLEAVSHWLSTALAATPRWLTKGQISQALIAQLPVTWFKHAVGKWNSLLIESADSPWATDLDCAQAAYATLGVEVRCSLGGWQESQGEADADQWLKVTAEGVTEFTWRV